MCRYFRLRAIIALLMGVVNINKYGSREGHPAVAGTRHRQCCLRRQRGGFHGAAFYKREDPGCIGIESKREGKNLIPIKGYGSASEP